MIDNMLVRHDRSSYYIAHRLAEYFRIITSLNFSCKIPNKVQDLTSVTRFKKNPRRNLSGS